MKKLVLLTALLCTLAWTADNTTAKPVSRPATPQTDAITIPQMLSCQGRLTDTAGRAVRDSSYSMRFRLYTLPSGGSPFWNETQTVQTRGGLFSALLGSVSPVGSVPDAGVLYLGMQVGAAELTPRLRIVSAAYAYKADTANYALAGGGDNAWVRVGLDSVLYTIRNLGIARGGADNALRGNQAFTHTNLGVACTTGASGQDYHHATVGGGEANVSGHTHATVGGGYGNVARYEAATVGGGYQNAAASFRATVGGGYCNVARAAYATVCGGYRDSASGAYSFAANASSAAAHSNSAAFNGQTTTASDQTRVGILSKASGTFTIDHPLDPSGTILNHYFIEGPEMLNIYRGSVVLDAAGRADVTLPAYFDALNRNPMVQLTGVGTREVIYVAEDVFGSRFTIGGPAGAKVYWQVTGERRDVSAEATRRMMPVEQPKTGPLAGRMLDDEFLSGCMEQLVREGKAQGIDFRTEAGRQRYEDMKRMLEEPKK